MKKKTKELIVRITWGIIGILLILVGVYSLHKGHFHYYNYWGGAVFAPYAIFGGILILLLVIFKWIKAKNIL